MPYWLRADALSIAKFCSVVLMFGRKVRVIEPIES